jgi:hypothetical protein
LISASNEIEMKSKDAVDSNEPPKSEPPKSEPSEDALYRKIILAVYIVINFALSIPVIVYIGTADV